MSSEKREVLQTVTLTGPKLILDNYELKYSNQVKNIGLTNTKNLNWTEPNYCGVQQGFCRFLWPLMLC